MRTPPLYASIAQALTARANCEAHNNTEWLGRWTDRIKELMDMLPSGSGIDHGTKLDEDKSDARRLVFIVDFHHMNDAGMYDGWTEHTVIVTPAFDGIDLRITGRDRNGIKEYLADTYHDALTQTAEPMTAAE